MARIRTVKPDYWTDERVGECSVSARLLFIACWNFSDDHGGLDRSAKQLKAQAFPYDAIDCEPLVQELLNAGLLVEYSVDCKTYLHIKGFRKHQKVEKPAKPRVPVYEPSLNSRGVLTESSPSPHLGVAVSSLEGKGMEGKGREEEREMSAEPTAVEFVFEHWKSVWGHTTSKLDDKRRKIIREALQNYSEAAVCQCISGYQNSPHHTGQNDRATVYDSIELFLRDAKHIDAGLKFYTNPPRTDLSEATRRTIAQTEDWQPPETRRAAN